MRNELITKEQFERLFNNRVDQALRSLQGDERLDLKPIVKLTAGNCVWLLAQVYPGKPPTAYGLRYCGTGSPSLEDINLVELLEAQYLLDEPIINHENFRAEMTLNEYLRLAIKEGRIVT